MELALRSNVGVKVTVGVSVCGGVCVGVDVRVDVPVAVAVWVDVSRGVWVRVEVAVWVGEGGTAIDIAVGKKTPNIASNAMKSPVMASLPSVGLIKVENRSWIRNFGVSGALPFAVVVKVPKPILMKN